MNYNEAQNYINEISKIGSRPGIDAIKELLLRLDNPQDKLNVIHIGGTNGKGSVGAYLDFGYRECGLNVGRYISPTLFSYLERFQINGQEMKEEDFCEFLSEVKDKCDEMVSDGLLQPTAFEVETAISFMYFVKNKVDLVLLEVGMGGELDATNVVKKPIATVFTSISYDHCMFLGNTIEEIAKSKAGIMREEVLAIASRMPFSEAGNTLKMCAKKINAPFYYAENSSDFTEDIKIINEALCFRGEEIRNPLGGEFQTINLETALLVFDVLKNKCILNETNQGLVNTIKILRNADIEKLLSGIQKTKWPGRFEIVCEKPLIIRDGAHNPDAVRLLRKTIENKSKSSKEKGISSKFDKIHLIMGVFKDKDYEDMLRTILPLAKSFTAITPPNAVRALPAKSLCECAEKIYRETKNDEEISFSYHNSLEEAIESVNAKEDEVILVFGSLSLAGLFKNSEKVFRNI